MGDTLHVRPFDAHLVPAADVKNLHAAVPFAKLCRKLFERAVHLVLLHLNDLGYLLDAQRLARLKQGRFQQCAFLGIHIQSLVSSVSVTSTNSLALNSSFLVFFSCPLPSVIFTYISLNGSSCWSSTRPSLLMWSSPSRECTISRRSHFVTSDEKGIVPVWSRATTSLMRS